MCRRTPILSHLLFSDYCFLFCRATEKESTTHTKILDIYGKASINWSTYKNKRFSLSAISVSTSIGSGKYLEQPFIIGRNKKVVFGFLKDRIWKCIDHWSGKQLSEASKEVLIKSCAQAISSYCMSVYLLPAFLEEDIQRMKNSFWWDSKTATSRGINWLSWDKLSMKEEFGGLGFHNLHGFNLSMLGNQGWKLITHPNATVTKFTKLNIFLKEVSIVTVKDALRTIEYHIFFGCHQAKQI